MRKGLPKKMVKDLKLYYTYMRQSPINIVKQNTIKLASPDLLQINYPAIISAKCIDKTTTLQLDPMVPADIIFNGRPYSIMQIHFHRPSEHKINGHVSPMECHIVHQAAWEQPTRVAHAGSLLVIGVTLKVTPNLNVTSNCYDNILNSEPNKNIEFNPLELLPKNKSFFTYAGSLTTPSFDERVQWVMMEHPSYIAESTLNAYSFKYNENARPCHDGDCSHVFYQFLKNN